MTPAMGFDADGSAAGMIAESSVKTTTATTMPTTQPTMKPTLVPRAFGESSMRIAAMIGMGLMAIPRALGRISPMTPFTSYPSRPVEANLLPRRFRSPELLALALGVSKQAVHKKYGRR
jgi:hypothetical protein